MHLTPSGAIEVTLSGLQTGALYALFLIGVLLVYQVSKMVNFSYGQLGMLAAFGSWWLYSQIRVPVPLAIGIGVAASIAAAWLTEVLVIRRIPQKRFGYDLVVSLGVLLLLTAGAELVFGTTSQTYLGLLSSHRLIVSGVFVNGNDILVLVVGIVASIVTKVVLDKTGAGLSLRASSENPPVARSVGINVTPLRSTIWAISGLFAAGSGILLASRLSVDPFYMTPFLVNTFIAGMIGGLDRYWPPVIAAFGLGIYDSWAIYILGPNGVTIAIFVLALIVLSVAPKRFVEERYESRA